MLAGRVQQLFVTLFQMVPAPDDQRVEDVFQVFAALGQRIFVPGRVLGVEATEDQIVLLQIFQPLRQQVRGNAGQIFLDLVECRAPGQYFVNDQQRPAIADDIERLCDIARQFIVFFQGNSLLSEWMPVRNLYHRNMNSIVFTG